MNKIEQDELVVGNIIEGVDGQEIICSIFEGEVYTRVLEDAGNCYKIEKDGSIQI